MKLFKVLLTTAMILFLVNTAFAEYYPRTAVVTELDIDNDRVIATDWAGLSWEFFGIEDWCELDIVSMILDDNNTPETIYDDIIVKAYYGGWVNEF